ncbi:hypothetical protein MHO82_14390 [Vibrio sp. Of7-15]|uniref:hypothetical protein n=1 Tax=Vibrio sp. Of7-15 TaxID=2724879 RepID=UPI001EF224F9|nr:hypothetical protein [Vibrio sp. Of7-15]MCG7498056.1 hypothetical protein [Vibrio sp. Of7-15]
MRLHLPSTVGALALCLASSYAYAQKENEIAQSEQEGRNAYFQKEYSLACQQPLTTLNPLAATLDEAAQQEVTLEGGLGYRAQLNSQGEGYLQLAITEWNEKLVIFHHADLILDLPGADVTGSRIKNFQCPEQEKLLTHFNTHEWGSYTLKLVGKPDQKIEFSIVKEVKR